MKAGNDTAAERLLVGALAAVVVFGLAVAPSPAFANVALPEVVIITDASQSMQYVPGKDKAPVCGGKSTERSRWIRTLEVLQGDLANYACTQASLPSHPDQTKPPKQQQGDPTCIPGVAASLFEPHKPKPSSNFVQPMGDFSWKNNGAVSNLAQLKFQMTTDDTVVPYFVFDLSKLPDDKDWVAATLTIYTMAPASNAGAPIEAFLVRTDTSPAKVKGSKFVCAVGGPSLNPVSPPTKVANKTGLPTVFQLNKGDIDKLKAEKKAGLKEAFFAIVPVEGHFDSNCLKRTSYKNPFEIIFEGPATNTPPSLAVGVGKACKAEGPNHHFAPTGAFQLNGVLDIFAPSAKFGLLAPDNVMSAKPDATGAYSYGPTLQSLWGNIGIGAQNPFNTNSRSVQMPGADSLAIRKAAYTSIKSSLNALRPVGGTPLGQQLQDAVQYFGPSKYMDKHFQSTQDDPVHGDPLFACRARMIVVISDGGANQAGGVTSGRAAAVAGATKLFSRGVHVHVFDIGSSNAKDAEFLDDLANAGGTTKAVKVNTVKDAIDYLRPVLTATAAVGEVLTRTHYTESTGVDDETMHSFQHKSVFNVADPLLTSGTIEQRIFKCSEGCVDAKNKSRSGVCKVIDYEERMKNRTVPRRIFTMKNGGRVELKVSNISSDDMTITKTGLAPKLFPDPNTGSCATQSGTFNLANSVERDQYRDHLIQLLRGDAGSCRENKPLGAPSRAQPQILEPAARLGIREPSFLTYRNTKVGNTTAPYAENNPPGSFKRPTMMFAATHDGFLHAFRTDNDPDIDTKGQLTAGDEMWSWLPGFNLRRARALRLVTSADSSYLGAAVVTGHYLLDRQGKTVKEQALRWRAVVIAGAGEAGAGYTALDVTAPDEPRLLWEITPDRHCWGDSKMGSSNGPVCAAVTTFEEMGRSTALPVLINLFFKKNGTTVQRSVAVIAGGLAPKDSDQQNFGVDGLGKRVVYIVALENGELIRKFTLADIDLTGATTSMADTSKIGYHITEPACFNAAPGQLATRCYLGDSRGMMWRLDLSDIDPDKWKLQFFHDAYSGNDTKSAFTLPLDSKNRVPILTRPSLATRRGGQLVVVYGTGNLDDQPSATRRHLVYSLTETFKLTAAGAAPRAEAGHNWGLPMTDHTRFIGPPVVFGGNAYWSSYTVSATGACKAGTARIFSVDFSNRGQINATNAPKDPIGGFQIASDDTSKSKLVNHQVLGQYKPSGVDITPIPACVGGCSPGDASCFIGKASALSGSKPSYEVGVGTAGTTQAASQKARKGAKAKIGTISRKIAAPRSTSIVTGWDLLLD